MDSHRSCRCRRVIQLPLFGGDRNIMSGSSRQRSESVRGSLIARSKLGPHAFEVAEMRQRRRQPGRASRSSRPIVSFSAARGSHAPTRRRDTTERLEHTRHGKYAMWDAHCRMPSQSPEGWSVCICGTRITVNGMGQHIDAHVPILPRREN